MTHILMDLRDTTNWGARHMHMHLRARCTPQHEQPPPQPEESLQEATGLTPPDLRTATSLLLR